MVPPKFGPMRPFLLLVRGARRGCFHPRSFAVLTDSLPRRAFSPRARLSAAAVWRLLLRGQHGYTLLYAICRGLSSRRVYFLYPYAVKGLLLGLTMSRPLSPPAVLPHVPSLPARRGGRPCPPNTAQRCHSEPVRRLAWESVPLASLFGGALFFVKTRRSTEGILCVCRSAAATYRRKSPAAFGGALFFVKTRRSTEGILCVCRSAAATYRRKSPAAFGGALFFVKTRRSTEGILCVCRSAATMYWRKSPAAYTPSPSNAGVYASSAEVRSCTNPSVMPQFRI